MASFGYNYSILWAFFVATTVATISAASMDEPVEQCAKHIGSHCGKQVFDKVLYNYNASISLDCCYKLVQMGHPCQTKLVKSVLESKPVFRNSKANWTKILAKSDKVFHECDVITNPGNPVFLANCHGSIGSHCVDQVYGKLVHDEILPRHCCKKLVEAGLPCHIRMVKDLIRTDSGMRNANATEVLMKALRIFHECQRAKQVILP